MYDFTCRSRQSSYLYVGSLKVYESATVTTHSVFLPIKYTTYLNSTRQLVKLTEQWIKDGCTILPGAKLALLLEDVMHKTVIYSSIVQTAPLPS